MRISMLVLLACIFFHGPAKAQHTIRVMTYNIKYDAKSDTANNWHVRKPWVKEVLEFNRPDILGIQEALLNQVNDIREILGPYERIGVGRDDGANAGEFSPVYYDTSRFNRIDGGTFWLSDTPEKVSVGWDAALPRVCSFGFLEEKQSGKQFVVYNAHLDHIGEQSRRNAMTLILGHARANYPGRPLVLMGDFNFTDADPAYTSLVEFPLTDSRDAARVFGPKETFNGFNWEQKPEVRIDYIFASEDVTFELHKVITTSFPKRYPSDHFPVIADIQLN